MNKWGNTWKVLDLPYTSPPIFSFHLLQICWFPMGPNCLTALLLSALFQLPQGRGPVLCSILFPMVIFPMVLHTVGDGKCLLTAAEKMNWMSFYCRGLAEKNTLWIKSLTSSSTCLTSVHSSRISPPARAQISGISGPPLSFVQNICSKSNDQVLGSLLCDTLSIHSAALMPPMPPLS